MLALKHTLRKWLNNVCGIDTIEENHLSHNHIFFENTYRILTIYFPNYQLQLNPYLSLLTPSFRIGGKSSLANLLRMPKSL